MLQVCGNQQGVSDLVSWLVAWKPGAGAETPAGEASAGGGSAAAEHDSGIDEDFLTVGSGQATCGRVRAYIPGEAGNRKLPQASVRRRRLADLSSDDDDDDDDDGLLGEARPCNALWLSGPTGCGKTTAVAAVARVSPRPVPLSVCRSWTSAEERVVQVLRWTCRTWA